MKIEKITENGYKTSDWSGGKTREIYIYPENASYAERKFLFRVSSATVDIEESEFTKLENVKRYIMPLENTEFSLTHENFETVKLSPYDIHYFDGNIKTVCRGKGTDFNLMLKNCSGNMKILQKNRIKNAENISFLILFALEDSNITAQNTNNFFLKKSETLVFKLENNEKISVKSDKNAVCVSIGKLLREF